MHTPRFFPRRRPLSDCGDSDYRRAPGGNDARALNCNNARALNYHRRPDRHDRHDCPNRPDFRRLLSLCALFCLCLCFLPACADSRPSGEILLIFDGKSCVSSDERALQHEETDTVYTIVKPGTYRLTGTLDDGQLCVSLSSRQAVTLILDNWQASCSTSAPLYIKQAQSAVILLAPDSQNRLIDARSYVYVQGETKPNACLYAATDLTLRGDGVLRIQGNANNGIGCRKHLKIEDGTYRIRAVNNAIKGNDRVTIEGGDITVTRCHDGIKTDNTGAKKGILTIRGGNISITASDDAFQASREIVITNGEIAVSVGGKAVNCDGNISVSVRILTKNN